MSEKKRVMIYVEPRLWKEIKIAALEQDKSASQYLADCHLERCPDCGIGGKKEE